MTLLCLSILVTVLLALLFVAAGAVIFRFGFRELPAPPFQFRWGLSFFLGLALFLSLFAAFARITQHAGIGFWISLAALGGVVAIDIVGGRFELGDWRKLMRQAVLLPVLFAAFAVNTAIWYLGPHSNGGHIMNHFGSTHSGRYANIASYIAVNDRIPLLNQNSAQSILASSHLLLGVDTPVAALMLWLIVSQLGLALLVYGALRFYRLNPWLAFFGAGFVLFCNIALSVTHINILDTHSPVLANGSQDSIASCATLLGMLIWLSCFLKCETTSWSALVVPGVLAIEWNLSAPQNLVLVGMLVGLVAVYFLFRGGVQRLRAAAVLGVFVLGAGSGTLLGGMMMPAAHADETGLPQILSTNTGAKTTVDPFCPFVVLELHGGLTCWDHMYRPFPEWEQRLSAAKTRCFFFWAETRFWETLRIYFFPLAGIGLLTFMLARASSTSWKQKCAWVTFTPLFAATLFVPGYAAAFVLRYHGYKWELSRFVFPGVLLGLVCFVVGLHLLVQAMKYRWVGKAVWAAALFLGTVGPMSEMAIVFQQSFLDRTARQSKPIKTRIGELLEVRGIRG